MIFISTTQAAGFWKKNLKLIAVLLAAWFCVSYLLVILLADHLNSIRFLGTTLPFWFGQQGSIISFLCILIIYALKMDGFNAELAEKEFKPLSVTESEPEAVKEEVLV